MTTGADGMGVLHEAWPWSLMADQQLSWATLHPVLAALLHMPPEHIRYVEDWATIAAEPSAPADTVWCELAAWEGGEFRFQLTMSRGYEATGGPQFSWFASMLAQRLKCSLLLSDRAVNPYSWIVARPDGTLQHVFTQVAAGEHGQIVIDRPAHPPA